MFDLIYPSNEVDYSNFKCGMSNLETNFIVDLIKKYNPTKVVEIGVAAGGTTSIILKNLSTESSLFSVDINELFYADKNHKTGYIVDEICTNDEKRKLKSFYGKDIINCIDEIGNNIDLCIIDTVHALPGELLSFFVIYKYLHLNSLVILHDVTLNYMGLINNNMEEYYKDAYATSVLLNTVSSEKKYLLDVEIPNIGAFEINECTEYNIDSLFMALNYRWHYYPDNFILDYLPFIKNNYNDFCYRAFKNALWIHKKYL